MDSTLIYKSSELCMKRREFIKSTIVGIGLAFFDSFTPISISFASVGNDNNYTKKLEAIPHLFCMAWIDPAIDEQMGQERIAAKFPLALVTQDLRKLHKRWKDDVREKNPEILYLAYQMVIEETTVPGPGHNVMRRVENAWVKYPTGYLPYVTIHGNKKRRIFDSRMTQWQRAFVEACDVTLSSYEYDGLFLDQCAIFSNAALAASTRQEMQSALQEVLLEVRKRWPDKILVANSRDNWIGLNGEMNENRPNEYVEELVELAGHNKPRVDLACIYIEDSTSMEFIEKKMWEVVGKGGMFAACNNPQHIRWFDFFDRLIENHKIKIGQPKNLKLNDDR